ncbi:MAG: phosphopantothenoylcysteine decarboxylase [candidate division Zixibacteria bacterium RBG_16_43_9]|nr:MAG: phosphopantothenoylcysteine decarboxylase [candidate division Zixibacteria bacterium RBG_16_43_9]
MLKGKKIILGITGGIAAYKSAELCRRLKKSGAEVQVIMTQSGMKFITPLTMECLSEKEVITEMFPERRMVGTRHISLAQWADLVLVAPATYNLIGKISCGIADDILTTVISSTKAPVFFAPAMNVNMYENPICQQNIEKLRKLGYRFIEPGVGDLACGDVGKGRMAEPEEILNEVIKLLDEKKDLTGKSILVTASRTEEPIDAVRFLSNRSTGRMGYAVAEEAFKRGAKVTLISGPSDLNCSSGINLVKVRTADEMYKAVKKHFAKSDALVMTAAVSDFAPEKLSSGKLKKQETELSLNLKQTPDILREMGKQKGKKVLVGFAVETKDEIQNAKSKLKEKNLDLIIVNNPNLKGAGFEVDTNIATLIDRKGKAERLPLMSKKELAEKIIDRMVKLLKR